MTERAGDPAPAPDQPVPTEAPDTGQATESGSASGPVHPAPAVAASEAGPTAAGTGPRAVHRYGLLAASGLVRGPGDAVARLRLDPAELDLPPGSPALVAVDLLATAGGPGQATVLDRRTLELAPGHPMQELLRGRLPDERSPYRILATVRVTTDRSTGRPRADLGSGSLELADPGR